MPTPDPKSYADAWVRGWNAHDVEVLIFNGDGLVHEGHGTYLV